MLQSLVGNRDFHILESFFGQKLDLIRVEIVDTLHHPILMGRRGCATEDTIYLAQYANDFEEAMLEIVIHELCHIIQKRNSKKSNISSHAYDLEAEAHRATHCFYSNTPFICTESDNTDKVRYWNEAGHYYTTALVFANAGWPNFSEIAKFCWLPDHVFEFAATETIIGGSLRLIEQNFANYLNLLDDPMPRHLDAAYFVKCVQEGLHSLTGRKQIKELEYRSKVLKLLLENNSSVILQGLAAHAFGDCFSHCKINDPTTMYNVPFGHAEDGHDADAIWKRAQNYCNYFRALSALSLSAGRKFKVHPEILLRCLKPMLGGGVDVENATVHRVLNSAAERAGDRQLISLLSRAEWFAAKGNIDNEQKACHFLSLVSEMMIGDKIPALSDFSPPLIWKRYYERYRPSIGKVTAGDEETVFTVILKKAADWASGSAKATSINTAIRISQPFSPFDPAVPVSRAVLGIAEKVL